MMYKRYDLSETNLEKGMIVDGTVKTIKPYGVFIEMKNRGKWTVIY